MSENFKEAALRYHSMEPAGKLEITATKPMTSQRDLALAYSPGVAYACEAIVEDEAAAAQMTGRGNLVGVITNGTAVLGLGPIGPLASKPVMEGKAVLFKKFAGINCFDIEVDTTDVDEFVNAVALLEPTFGGINLEDIKAPECFEIEKRLRARMNIPVFHDDQHGTAIVVSAAFLNAFRVANKPIEDVKLVCAGAGAAALACLNMLVSLGMRRENITVCDIEGVVYEGRTTFMDPYKSIFAQATDDRTLVDAIKGKDAFLGCSAPGIVTQDMLKTMADSPIIFALANPTPEIMPDLAREARPDAIVATGRSDFPNQVNNVLCFPFLFRGALDVGATTVNEEMKKACAHAIADLAMAPPSPEVASAYGNEAQTFGPDNLIPKPFDPRLIVEIATAVAKAAIDSGVATRPITDFEAYRERLNRFVFRSGILMKPVFERAKAAQQRLIYAEGESGKVLQAVQRVVSEKLARPILVGRPPVIQEKIDSMSLNITAGVDFDIIDYLDDEQMTTMGQEYYKLMARRGVTPKAAQARIRANFTLVACMALRMGMGDSMVCGSFGSYRKHLEVVKDVIGKRPGVDDLSALSVLILPRGTFFIADTHVTYEPTPQQICESTLLAAEEMRQFGITPKAALVSHSNFGSSPYKSAVNMQQALSMIRELAPDLEIEGEMHADAALDENIRADMMPESLLTGEANLLIMPNLDAANIARNLLKVLGGGVSVGPLLLGADMPVHIMTSAVTVRGIVNISAMAAVDSIGR
ncbi:NADP-dependent malic enzyme [Litorivicinus lipolyticus]|uniref:NADP-dependent malic enzyme n=1 Tax=Litorivicinus lipolyticus TaxID=418701 RepID=A0A5Q2QBV8_9GAMM|nr:NADP-dependent malic enzyme [Litorivicinus lipolyticus]QGG80773.1 NADP-dependent malic enzyme [Litorivicinus lipolyticus]